MPLAINVDKEVVNARFAPKPKPLHFTQPGLSPINTLFSKSDLLGGILTLSSLREPLMPPIAMAERAQLARTGDPLASIPQNMREAMRKAIKGLINGYASTTKQALRTDASDGIDQARIVHVPSAKISRAEFVPLALQSDGSVDILTKPDNPVILDEIKTWSGKQELPSQGRLVPAIVHLHPLVPLERETSSVRMQSPSEQAGGNATKPSNSLTEVQQTATAPSIVSPTVPVDHPEPKPDVPDASKTSVPIQAESTAPAYQEAPASAPSAITQIPPAPPDASSVTDAAVRSEIKP